MPRLLLRLEGAAVFAAATALYFDGGHAWWLYLALLLAPDLSMLGYLAGPRAGAASYDLIHTYVGPLGVAAAGVLAGVDGLIAVALIWGAHIGLDRLLGYGLKYESGFKDTHLQRV